MAYLRVGRYFFIIERVGKEKGMDHRYAVIDIGTNSVRLMLADIEGGKIKTVLKTLNTVRIGEGMGKSNSISEAAMKRTILALAAYKKQALEEGAKKLYVFATSAVREAENKQEFIKAVQERCGIAIDVISGEEEAQIGFLGAAGRGEKCGIIDIGGGSTEVICGQNEDLSYMKSFRVGTVRALSLFPENESPKALSKARAWVSGEIAELSEKPFFVGVPFVGIGGTATALAAIALGLKTYDPDKVQGYILTQEKLSVIFHMLSSMTVEQRKSVTGLDSMRADVIVYGCMIMMAFMSAIGLTQIEVSDRDNQEGYLIRQLNL